MIRIGTHNVNGIRAALRRGFRDYWDETTADVVALPAVNRHAGLLECGNCGGDVHAMIFRSNHTDSSRV